MRLLEARSAVRGARARRLAPTPIPEARMQEEPPHPSGRALVIFGAVMLVMILALIGVAAVLTA